MNFKAKPGVYPTMITPYRNGEVDYCGVENLVEWYWNLGCDGIFADCQSSEIRYLTLDERVKILRTVLDKAESLAKANPCRDRMMIVASGHVADTLDEQVEELCALAKEGPDALILISNRMDIENTTEDKWIEETKALVARLPEDMPLGVYECPAPYKRLLSEKMIAYCAESGRFSFIKDTCCDAATIARRVELCKGSPLKIFNANAQTLLQSMKDGAYGYCGVMANFHPDLYVNLLHSDLYSEKATLLQGFLGIAANIENYCYPCCAKYYIDRFEGIPMSWEARSADVNNLTEYYRGCVDQLADLTNAVRAWLAKGE